MPALIDSEARFAVKDGSSPRAPEAGARPWGGLRRGVGLAGLVETKPHGHGDVHTLLYQTGPLLPGAHQHAQTDRCFEHATLHTDAGRGVVRGGMLGWDSEQKQRRGCGEGGRSGAEVGEGKWRGVGGMMGGSSYVEGGLEVVCGVRRS